MFYLKSGFWGYVFHLWRYIWKNLYLSPPSCSLWHGMARFSGWTPAGFYFISTHDAGPTFDTLFKRIFKNASIIEHRVALPPRVLEANSLLCLEGSFPVTVTDVEIQSASYDRRTLVNLSCFEYSHAYTAAFSRNKTLNMSSLRAHKYSIFSFAAISTQQAHKCFQLLNHARSVRRSSCMTQHRCTRLYSKVPSFACRDEHSCVTSARKDARDARAVRHWEVRTLGCILELRSRECKSTEVKTL